MTQEQMESDIHAIALALNKHVPKPEVFGTVVLSRSTVNIPATTSITLNGNYNYCVIIKCNNLATTDNLIHILYNGSEGNTQALVNVNTNGPLGIKIKGLNINQISIDSNWATTANCYVTFEGYSNYTFDPEIVYY